MSLEVDRVVEVVMVPALGQSLALSFNFFLYENYGMFITGLLEEENEVMKAKSLIQSPECLVLQKIEVLSMRLIFHLLCFCAHALWVHLVCI